MEIRRLDPAEIRAFSSALGAVLHDCVEGGASVSFMAGLTLDRAAAFWREVADAALVDSRAVLAAFDDQGVVGVVQVVPAGPENQPHRGDVAKMLVHRRARRRGVGAALMQAAEAAARDLGLTVLVLDTVTGGDTERLYQRLGWSLVGVVPNFALMPDGALCATTFFHRQLG